MTRFHFSTCGLLFLLLCAPASQAAQNHDVPPEWRGSYVAGMGGPIVIEANAFSLTQNCSRGGDTVDQAGVTGRAALVDGAIVLTPDPSAAPCRLTATLTFLPVKLNGRHVLLDNFDLFNTAASINQWGHATLDGATHLASEGERADLGSTTGDFLPERYRKLILAKPIVGTIVAMGPVTRKEVVYHPWMRPAENGIEFYADLTLDIGAADGVNEAVRFFDVGQRDLQVTKINAHTTLLRAAWTPQHRVPEIGEAIPSSATYQLQNAFGYGTVSAYDCGYERGAYSTSGKAPYTCGRRGLAFWIGLVLGMSGAAVLLAWMLRRMRRSKMRAAGN